ncbi:MAG: HEPN domain-containing protein [Acidobacteriota bacterium]
MPFPRTHDLEELLKLAVGLEPAWANMQTAVAPLTDYAVDYRYPGLSATEAEARDAVQKCEACRGVFRHSPGLAPQ